MKKSLTLLILILSLSLTGCASMISGTSQQITLNSEVKGAKLYLNDEYIGTDSAVTKVSKSKLSDAVLKAKKDGCADAVKTVDTKVDGTAFLGCLLDLCIFSVILTDTVITGAIKEAERTSYILNPKCN
jgi:uncharacterized lipoprotein YehR (DUF1307 family)